MRKVQIQDMYLLSEIADKLEFSIPEVEGKTQQQLGAELMLQLFKKIHKAKNEINELIENISGKSIENMTFAEVKNIITEIFKQEGVFDFFKSVDK